MSPRRKPLLLGGEKVRPGSLRSIELPVARLPTGTWLSLPVAVLHGVRPGPTIWLSAAIHGDELNGVPIIRKVLRRVEPTELNGTIIAVPVVNVFGLVNESRYLPDRRDLNRSFPGSKRGSLASQLAHLFMTEVVRRCELGIDLHTGSGGRTNLPQLRCNLDDPEVLRLAKRFGTRVVLDSKLRKGSLRDAANALGIRVLLYEAGEALRFDTQAIDFGVSGVLRVLAELGMWGAEPDSPHQVIVSRSSRWVRAKRSGFCQMSRRLGDEVAAGDTVAKVFDAIGHQEADVRAESAGIVIGHLNNPLVNRGDAIAHIAEPEPA